MTVTATEGWGNTFNSYITPQITVVAGARNFKLQSFCRKSRSCRVHQQVSEGTVANKKAGQSFNVRVNLVDANWNKVTTTGYSKQMPMFGLRRRE